MLYSWKILYIKFLQLYVYIEFDYNILIKIINYSILF